MELNKEYIEQLVRQVISEKVGSVENCMSNPIKVCHLPEISVSESDRFDTGYSFDKVYTKDVLSLKDSPRLGCGIMEMTGSKFDWTLNYDEIDYVINGELEIICNGIKNKASAGEIIFIPKGSKISFSAEKHTRFMYVTYPADWANQ